MHPQTVDRQAPEHAVYSLFPASPDDIVRQRDLGRSPSVSSSQPSPYMGTASTAHYEIHNASATEEYQYRQAQQATSNVNPIQSMRAWAEEPEVLVDHIYDAGAEMLSGAPQEFPEGILRFGTDDELLQFAEDLRLEGNLTFHADEVHNAVCSYGQALRCVEEVLSRRGLISPQSELGQIRMQLLGNLFAGCLAVGSFEDAARVASEALEMDPWDAGFRYRRAIAMYQLGHFTEALDDVSFALQLDPEHLEAQALMFVLQNAAHGNEGEEHPVAIQDEGLTTGPDVAAGPELNKAITGLHDEELKNADEDCSTTHSKMYPVPELSEEPKNEWLQEGPSTEGIQPDIEPRQPSLEHIFDDSASIVDDSSPVALVHDDEGMNAQGHQTPEDPKELLAKVEHMLAEGNRSFFFDRDYESARTQFEAALGILDSSQLAEILPDGELEHRRCHLLTQLAECCFQLELFRDVVFYASGAIELDSGANLHNWHRRGLARHHLGELDGALNDLRRVHAVQPDSVRARIEEITANLAEQSRPTSAATPHSKESKRSRGSTRGSGSRAPLFLNLGRPVSGAKRPDSATKMCQPWEKLNPADVSWSLDDPLPGEYLSETERRPSWPSRPPSAHRSLRSLTSDEDDEFDATPGKLDDSSLGKSLELLIDEKNSSGGKNPGEPEGTPFTPKSQSSVIPISEYTSEQSTPAGLKSSRSLLSKSSKKSSTGYISEASAIKEPTRIGKILIAWQQQRAKIPLVESAKIGIHRFMFFFDLVTDVLLAVHLVYKQRMFWAATAVFWMVLPYAVMARFLGDHLITRIATEKRITRNVARSLFFTCFLPYFIYLDFMIFFKYTFREPRLNELFTYIRVRQLAETAFEAFPQAMMQAYMIYQGKAGDIDMRVIALSICSSFYTLVSYTILIRRYAHVHTKGSVMDYVIAMRDLGKGLAPTSLITEIWKKIEVDCTMDCLSSRAFEEVCTAIIDSKVIERMIFSSTAITDEGVPPIIHACNRSRTMEHLTISNPTFNKQSAINLVNMLESKEGLKLHIWDTVIDESNSRLVSKTLQDKVAGLHIGDMTFIACLLKRTSYLLFLDLSENDICDAGAKQICNALSENFTLRELKLDNNKITDVGAENLANTLVSNNVLRTLSVEENDIGQEGMIKLLQAIAEKKNVKIESDTEKVAPILQVMGCHVERNDSLALIHMLRNDLVGYPGGLSDREMKLIGCALQHTELVERLDFQPLAHMLAMSDICGVLEGAIYCRNKNLVLNFFGSPMRQFEFKAIVLTLQDAWDGLKINLKQAGMIGKVVMSTNRVSSLVIISATISHAAAIRLLECLEKAMNCEFSLNLWGTQIGCDEADVARRLLSNTLSGADIDDENLHVVSGILATCSLPDFRFVDFRQNPRITKTGFVEVLQALESNPRCDLQLNLFGALVQKGDGAILCRLLQDRLGPLTFEAQQVQVLTRALEQCNLELSLDLSRCTALGKGELCQILEAMERNHSPALITISMQGYTVRKAQAAVFRWLLEGVPFIHQALSEEELSTVVNAVRVCALIRTCDLGGCMLHRDQMLKMFQAASKAANSNLVVIICGVSICRKDCVIAQGLLEQKLAGEEITDDNIHLIVNLITGTPLAPSLDVVGHKLSSRGLDVLLDALKHKHNLKRLTLGHKPCKNKSNDPVPFTHADKVRRAELLRMLRAVYKGENHEGFTISLWGFTFSSDDCRVVFGSLKDRVGRLRRCGRISSTSAEVFSHRQVEVLCSTVEHGEFITHLTLRGDPQFTQVLFASQILQAAERGRVTLDLWGGSPLSVFECMITRKLFEERLWDLDMDDRTADTVVTILKDTKGLCFQSLDISANSLTLHGYERVATALRSCLDASGVIESGPDVAAGVSRQTELESPERFGKSNFASEDASGSSSDDENMRYDNEYRAGHGKTDVLSGRGISQIVCQQGRYLLFSNHATSICEGVLSRWVPPSDDRVREYLESPQRQLDIKALCILLDAIVPSLDAIAESAALPADVTTTAVVTNFFGYPMDSNECLVVRKLLKNELAETGASDEEVAIAARAMASTNLISFCDFRGNPSLSRSAAEDFVATLREARARGHRCFTHLSTIPVHEILSGTLTELDLSNQSLGDFEASVLARVLDGNSSLISIDLRHNPAMQTTSGEIFLEGLWQNESVRTVCDMPVEAIRRGRADVLDLRDRSLMDFEAVVLAGLLQRNTSLSSLDLRLNKIGSAGAEAFAELLMGCSRGRPDSWQSSPDAGWQPGATKAHFEIEQELESVDENSAPHSGLAVLSEIPVKKVKEGQVLQLDLSNKELNDFEVRVVSALLRYDNKIEDLNLRGNPDISAEGVASVEQMLREGGGQKISTLCGLPIRRFVQTKDLHELDMRAMGLGDAELLFLTSLLKRKGGLQSLDLRSNGRVTRDGAEPILKLCLSAKGPANVSLLPLHALQHNQMIDLDLRSQGLGGLESFLLLAALRENVSLKKLQLQDNLWSFLHAPDPGGKDSGSRVQRQKSKVKVQKQDPFWIANWLDCPILEDAEKHFLAVRRSWDEASGGGDCCISFATALMKIVRVHPKLESICDIPIRNLLEKGFASTTLNFQNHQFADLEVILLSQVLEKQHRVTSLDLRYNNGCTEQGMENLIQLLAKQNRAEQTNLGGGHERLQEVSGIPVHAILQGSLQSLSLVRCALGFQEICLICGLLERQPTSITSLDLRHNPLGAAAARRMARLFRESPEGFALQDLSGIPVQTLFQNKTEGDALVTLDLTGAQLGDFEIYIIAMGLRVNKCITRLGLKQNNFTLKGGACSLGRALRDLHPLTKLDHLELSFELDLSNLRFNRLETLDLRSQRLGTLETVVLFTVLQKQNSSLVEVQLPPTSLNLISVAQMYLSNGGPSLAPPPTEETSPVLAPSIAQNTAVLLRTFKDFTKANGNLRHVNAINLQDLLADDAPSRANSKQPVAIHQQSQSVEAGSSADGEGDVLDLASQGVGDIDAVLLAVLLDSQRTVTAVRLQGNRLSGVAARAIATTIESVPTLKWVSNMPVQDLIRGQLQELNLSGCDLGDMEVFLITFLCSEHNCRIHSLDFRKNPRITSAGSYAMYEFLRSPKAADLKEVSSIPVHGIVEFTTVGTEEVLQDLEGDLEEEKDLTMGTAETENEGICFDFSGCELGDFEAYLLYLLLRTVVDATSSDTDEPTLKCRPLRSLDLRNNPDISTAPSVMLCRVLRHHPTIEYISGIPVQQLRAASSTRNSFLSVDDSAVNVPQELDLRDRRLGDIEVLILSSALEENAKLRALDIRGNVFSKTVSEQFALSMKSNGTLQILSGINLEPIRTNKVVNLNLDDFGMSDFELQVLGALLRDNHSVQQLSLNGNHFSLQAVREFYELLQVTLADNLRMVGQGLKVFTLQQLRRNANAEFEVTGKLLGDFDCAILSQCIADSSSLKEVTFRNCVLKDGIKSASYVAPSLGISSSIEWFNDIPVLQLRENAVTELDLRGVAGCEHEHIGDFEVIILLELLKQNASIQEAQFSTVLAGPASVETALNMFDRLSKLEWLNTLPLAALFAGDMEELSLGPVMSNSKSWSVVLDEANKSRQKWDDQHRKEGKTPVGQSPKKKKKRNPLTETSKPLDLAETWPSTARRKTWSGADMAKRAVGSLSTTFGQTLSPSSRRSLSKLFVEVQLEEDKKSDENDSDADSEPEQLAQTQEYEEDSEAVSSTLMLHDFDLQMLAHVLSQSKSLQELNCIVPNPDELPLAKAPPETIVNAVRHAIFIATPPSLRIFNGIEVSTIAELQKGELRTLDLSGQKLRDFDLRLLFPFLEQSRGLLSVDLRGNAFTANVAEPVVDLLVNGSLARLDWFCGMPVSAIADGKISDLDLAYYCLGDFECFVLAHLLSKGPPVVKYLHLEGMQLDNADSPAALAFLEMLDNYEGLVSVSCVPVNDLKENKLQILTLPNSDLGDLEALVLAHLLRSNKTLKRLVLGMNQLEQNESTNDSGSGSSSIVQMWKAAVLVMAAVEASPNARLSVSLWGNIVRKQDCTKMRQLMEGQLKSREKEETDKEAEDDDEEENEEAPDEAKKFQDFEDTPLARLCLMPIQQIEQNQITEVNLKDLGMADFEMVILTDLIKGNSSIRKMDLRGNHKVTETAVARLVEPLQKHRKLQEVSGIPIKALSTIKTLDLQEKQIGDVEVFLLGEILRQGARLRHLNVKGNKFSARATAEFLKIIRAVPSLLSVSDVPVSDIRRNKLIDLNLKNKGLGDFEAFLVADCVKDNRSLHGLLITNNKFKSREAAHAICEAILGHPTLERFNHTIPIIAIRETRLKRLELSSQLPPLTDFDTIIISGLLKDRKEIETINVAHNNIGVTGFKALAQALNGLENLSFLDVHANKRMNATTFSDIMDSLIELQLEEATVNVCGYPIHSSEFVTLCAVIDNNLSGTQLGDLQVKVVSDAIQNIPFIHSLDLRTTGMNREQSITVLRALENSASSHFFVNIWGYPIEKADAVELITNLQEDEAAEVNIFKIAAQMGTMHSNKFKDNPLGRLSRQPSISSLDSGQSSCVDTVSSGH